MNKFKVCPIQGRQLLDVDHKDIFGDFRICNTYKSGGGYDKLPEMIKHLPGVTVEFKGDIGQQFVVQLYGCHLRCPYCYVTKDGVFGDYIEYTTQELIEVYEKSYKRHDVGVFHLMGGAPALYMDMWPELIDALQDTVVFHSDLLLTESTYDMNILNNINKHNTIYAINIKGTDSNNYYNNTGKNIDWNLFWSNFDKVMKSNLNVYVTFTNPNMKTIEYFYKIIRLQYGKDIVDNSYIIDIIDYNATKESKAWT